MKIFIGTVSLERNRWGSKEPSFLVSEWAKRFEADGIDGIELWDNHYLKADAAEQAKLADVTPPVSIFNTYVGFEDDAADARAQVAEAISRLGSKALKYNLGRGSSDVDGQKRNLLMWAEELPADCQLLCECHQGTPIETVEAAEMFHADLDPDRFGVMVHAIGDSASVNPWFDAFGDRVRQLHLQLRGADTDPETSEGREKLDASVANIKEIGFAGGLTLEFTRGIGREEDIETLYANTLVDLRYFREAFG